MRGMKKAGMTLLGLLATVMCMAPLTASANPLAYSYSYYDDFSDAVMGWSLFWIIFSVILTIAIPVGIIIVVVVVHEQEKKKNAQRMQQFYQQNQQPYQQPPVYQQPPYAQAPYQQPPAYQQPQPQPQAAQVTCPSCGSLVAEGASFCRSCGHAMQ